MRAADGETQGRDRFANWAAAALLAAAAQFVVLTLTAMLIYTGGSAFDPSADGYAFLHNYFSDLGMTETYDGAANWPALALFTYALVCVGFALIAFGFAVRRLADMSTEPDGGTVRGVRGVHDAPDARGARGVAALAALAATFSGGAYVGIALTPHDLVGAAHTQFVNAAFGFLLVFVLCLGYLETRARWPRRLVLANLVYAAALAVYVYLLFWGPSTEEESGLVFMVVAQKIIVYGSILNLGWQALGFRRILRETPAAEPVDSAAESS